MNKLLLLTFVFITSFSITQADWVDPLDETTEQRNARMQWWRDAKFGMFIHWGVYSVPAGTYKGEQIKGIGEWIMRNAEIPVAEYRDFAREFNPENYDPEAWVLLAKQAGMKYIVITSKHHDGFALFDSKVTNWDIVDATPYGEDLLRPLEKACRKHGIKLGFYYSQAQDWVHKGGGKARLEEGEFWDEAHSGSFDNYLHTVAYPQVKEILSGYDIDILWWDTPVWMNKPRADLLRRLIKLRPGLITNNRLGGDYKGDLTTPEQRIPATGLDFDWESCMTMNNTWGYKSYDHDWKSPENLIHNLIDITSKGGNFLLNVGPTSLGEIPQPSIERLESVGLWMRVNSEAIYGTSPSPFRKLPWGRCTQKDGKLYLHVFDWPEDGELQVPGLKNDIQKAYLLADRKHKKLKVENFLGEWKIRVPETAPDPIASVIVVEIKGEADVDSLYPTNGSTGTIALNPDMCDLEQHGYGEKMTIVEEDGVEFIRDWKTNRAHVSWDFMNNHTGRYRAVAEMRSNDQNSKDLKLQLQVGENRRAPVTLDTLEVGKWSFINLGNLDIASGLNTIRLNRRPLGNKYPELQIRNLKLYPVKSGAIPKDIK